MAKRSLGVQPQRAKAAKQLQATKYSKAGVQPLPEPYAAAKVTPDSLGIKDPGDGITFFVAGDTGGIKTPGPQNAVSCAMQSLLRKWKPSAFLHLGDVVYFNGDESEYQPQFYEPYGGLPLPVVAIPGNHDGDTTDDPSRAPLDTFMANFCDSKPSVPAADPTFEFKRHTQTQPSHDFAVEFEAVTIVGVYTNVASGGHFEEQQVAFLTEAFSKAPAGKQLWLAGHHPPFSVDAHHGGAVRVWETYQKVISVSGRTPDVILGGHVHDYQRFTLGSPATQSPVTFLLSGNGGYHNLHKLASDARAGETLADGVTFEYGDDGRYGFLALTVKGGKTSGEYVAVTPGSMPDGSDAQVFEGDDQF
jgi:hypothetical protein